MVLRHDPWIARLKKKKRWTLTLWHCCEFSSRHHWLYPLWLVSSPQTSFLVLLWAIKKRKKSLKPPVSQRQKQWITSDITTFPHFSCWSVVKSPIKNHFAEQLRTWIPRYSDVRWEELRDVQQIRCSSGAFAALLGSGKARMRCDNLQIWMEFGIWKPTVDFEVVCF